MSDKPARRTLSDAAAKFAKPESEPAQHDVASTPKTPNAKSARDRLRAPDREPIVAFSMHLPKSLHDRLTLAAVDLECTKVEIAREGLRLILDEIEGE